MTHAEAVEFFLQHGNTMARTPQEVPGIVRDQDLVDAAVFHAVTVAGQPASLAQAAREQILRGVDVPKTRDELRSHLLNGMDRILRLGRFMVSDTDKEVIRAHRKVIESRDDVVDAILRNL